MGPPVTTLVGACRNCGALLQGRFCAACGQEDLPLDPSVREVVGEVARELSDIDGRILRSVRRLFLSPGYLTREHFQGRRVAWMSPVRLYLLFSVCYFAMAALTGTTPVDVRFRATSGEEAEVIQATRRLGFSSVAEMQRAANQALMTWIPRAMFVLVPVFAWLVSRVRRRSGRKYPHHLIFACHVFAVFFGAQAIAIGVAALGGGGRVDYALRAAAALYAAAYTALALKAVYGGTVARAMVHTGIILALYWVATIVVTVAILVPVFVRG